MTWRPAEGFADLPGGGRIAYEIRGGGERWLLLVRPLGGTMALWGRFRDELAPSFRVVSFDARGTGRSSAAPRRTTTRSMARDALAVLDHLGVDVAHLFGISLGGMVATWLAADAPARVGRLVLASTVARGLNLSRGALVRGASMARCLLRSASSAEACLADRVLSEGFHSEHPDEVERIVETACREPASRTGIFRLLAAAALHDGRGCLARITAPTLVLRGERDPLLSEGAQRALAEGIAGARFEMVPAAGHALDLEQPVATAERVSAFLRAGTA